MNTAIEQYDIIVVGGGVTGLTFACAMADTSLKMAVLDSGCESAEWSMDHYDPRVFAITLASKSLFEALDVWAICREMRVSPFQKMQVWDSTGEIHFNGHEIGQSALGYIVENNVLKSALEKRIRDFENIDYRQSILLTECVFDEEAAILKAHDGSLFKAKLIIGADGANSWIRNEAAIELHTRDYGHHALIAMVETEKPHQKTARQHFLTTGPLAFLPLNVAKGEQHCSIVWSTSPEHAQHLLSLDEEAFCLRLEEAFDARLGKVLHASKRMAFPLTMRHAKQYVKQRLALIGDAAHTIHPLAGQGMNLGLLDAAALADILKTALQKNRNIASLATLRRYERWRKTDNLTMIAAMDVFKQLFASENMAVQSLRNAGLNLTNKLIPLKNEIMKRAMGLTGDLPSLARYEGNE